jgi:RNA polymerase sigma-70 factor (ECF subfamily)
MSLAVTESAPDAARPAPGLEAAFRVDARHLWGLCYRMTGSAADAEDLVQETFARALERPPRDTSRPWRPWLVRVAINLSRDHLRRRRRRGYDGPWLPQPIETAAEIEPSHEPEETTGRYERWESLSYAFLVALEALTPAQRAVLILRDAFDYTSAETAEALDMTEANARTTLHRARRAMREYDAARPRRNATLARRTRDALESFLRCALAGDVREMEALLARSVVALNDGGGRYAAARVPVVGASKVARFTRGVLRSELPRLEIREINGLPAIVGEYADAPPHLAPRFVSLIDLDRDGRIRLSCTQLAPEKLSGIAPVPD